MTSTPSTVGRDERQQASTWSELSTWLRSPVAPYYLILVSAGLLVGIGLVMVLSASSVKAYADSGSSFTVFVDQLIYAGGGILLAALAARVPTRWWRRVAAPAILVAVILQAMVVFTPLGVGEGGNRNWLLVGGRTLQPSEFGKVAIIVFGATVLTAKRKVIGRIGHALIPFVLPASATLIALVLVGRDLGTAMIMFAIVGGMLFAAGLPLRWFAAVGGLGAIGAAGLAIGSANRMQRIQVWLGDICTSPQVEGYSGCFQKVHAEYALADGGWWGVGLGASKEKWGSLPEPHNDFILAIIGEELGLPGTFVVLALFLVFAYACYRVVATTSDTFVRLATAGVMVWFASQVMLNVGSVIGMLPIIGVPLPLVSSGGSALVAALIAVGLLLSLARSVPGCHSALQGRPSTLRRTLAVLPGVRRGRR